MLRERRARRAKTRQGRRFQQKHGLPEQRPRFGIMEEARRRYREDGGFRPTEQNSGQRMILFRGGLYRGIRQSPREFSEWATPKLPEDSGEETQADLARRIQKSSPQLIVWDTGTPLFGGRFHSGGGRKTGKGIREENHVLRKRQKELMKVKISKPHRVFAQRHLLNHLEKGGGVTIIFDDQTPVEELSIMSQIGESLTHPERFHFRLGTQGRLRGKTLLTTLPEAFGEQCADIQALCEAYQKVWGRPTAAAMAADQAGESSGQPRKMLPPKFWEMPPGPASGWGCGRCAAKARGEPYTSGPHRKDDKCAYGPDGPGWAHNAVGGPVDLARRGEAQGPSAAGTSSLTTGGSSSANGMECGEEQKSRGEAAAGAKVGRKVRRNPAFQNSLRKLPGEMQDGVQQAFKRKQQRVKPGGEAWNQVSGEGGMLTGNSPEPKKSSPGRKRTPGSGKQEGIRSGTRLKDWWERVRQDPECGEISDEDIDAGLWKLHCSIGHGSREDMLRMLRIGKAWQRVISRCRQSSCDECARQKAPRIWRPVTVKKTRQFGDRLRAGYSGSHLM